jgi:hypothetical protein
MNLKSAEEAGFYLRFPNISLDTDPFHSLVVEKQAILFNIQKFGDSVRKSFENRLVEIEMRLNGTWEEHCREEREICKQRIRYTWGKNNGPVPAPDDPWRLAYDRKQKVIGFLKKLDVWQDGGYGSVAWQELEAAIQKTICDTFPETASEFQIQFPGLVNTFRTNGAKSATIK